ncbi:hypothetical protein H5T87_08425 [bacterium]|nr:hypothetical protein [bacterium]
MDEAVIYIYPQKELGKVNRLVFGNNQLGYQYDAWEWTAPEYSDKGSGIWDPDRDKPVQEMVNFAKDIGMTIARWPGGCGSHRFNWKKTIGPISKRPNQKFGLPEFLRFCQEINAIPIITVAEYFGTAQDAADLVEYLNAPDDGKHPWARKRAEDGRKEPWNVIWFEFGNESDHGDHKGRRYSPEEYSQLYRQYRSAMKKVDPKIKLGAVLFNDVTPQINPWTKTVVKLTGDIADFYIHHAYIPHYYRNDGVPEAKTLFQIALAGPRQIAEYYRELVKFIKDTTKRNIPLAITEFNGHFVQEEPVPYRLSLGCALVVAQLLQVFLQPELNIANAQYWQFANEYWGMVKGYNPPYTLRPAYWVFWLYHHHFGDVLIESNVQCGRYETAGGYGVMPQMGKPSRFKLFPENILPPQKWELTEVDGVKHWEEPDGTLVVDIQTDADLNYYHARKRMPAEPLMGYRVSAEVRTEGLEKSRGAQIQVGDGRGWLATQSAALSEEVKSEEWKKVSVDYITLPDTKEIEILARRLEGTGGRGKIWIRNVQVEKFQPFNLGAVPYLSVIASKKENKVFLAIVNRDVENPIQARIEGMKAKKARAFCLTGPSVDSTNEENPQNVKVLEIPVEIKNGVPFLSLPPHSFITVEIER